MNSNLIENKLSNTNKLDRDWLKIKSRLRFEYGEAIYNHWFKNLSILSLKEDVLVLKASNNELANFVKQQYLAHIISLWNSENRNIKKVTISVENNASDFNNLPINDEVDTKIQASSFFPLNINNKYTFKNFVNSKTNELAFNASKSLILKDTIFNPLFIYGPAGTGKTHLMHAIVNKIKKEKPNSKIIYISAEQFTNRFISSIQNKETTSFRNECRKCDFFLIDDVQFFSAKSSTQEEFFHTFNSLVEANCKIILSANISPNDLINIEERLKSRMCWGLSTQIHSANYELRLGILKEKVLNLDVKIPDEILEFIAQNIKSNIRSLEGALNRIIAHHQLFGKNITIDSLNNILGDILRAHTKSITVEQIQNQVCNHYNLDLKEIKSACRSRNIVRARQIAMYLSKKMTSFSLPQIGAYFGGKDHTTVIHSVKKVNKLMQNDKNTLEDIHILKKMIKCN